jgi:PAS domain S-box-containing protein
MKLGYILRTKFCVTGTGDMREDYFLTSMFQNAPMLVYINSIDHRYLFANNAWENFVGVTLEKIGGCSVQKVFSIKMACRFIETNQQVIESGTSLVYEELANVSGKQYYFHTTKLPLFDSTGRVEGVIGFSIDITKRRCLGETLQIRGNSISNGFEYFRTVGNEERDLHHLRMLYEWLIKKRNGRLKQS